MNLTNLTIASACAECITAAGRNRAAHTAATYGFAIQTFQQFLIDQGMPLSAPASEISIEHFIDFPAHLAAQNRKKTTIQVYLAGARYLSDWLTIAGLLAPTYEEMLRYKMAAGEIAKKRESKLPKTPAAGAVARICAAARALELPAPLAERSIALVELLASSGCRNEEITSLRVADLDLTERRGLVTGKGSKQGVIYFSPAAAEALAAYWAARGSRAPGAPVFSRHDRAAGGRLLPVSTTTVRAIVEQAAAAAGVSGFTPHSFRHAFAVQMLEETGDLALVQDLMRHANPGTTRVYATITAERLKSAHRKVFG
jgi:integrase/recombinase XerC